jgi:predicted Zn-dependent peptidase
MLAPEVIKNAGVGQLDKYELNKVMTINSIQNLSTYVTDTESGIKGKLSGQNLAVFFDLLQDHFDPPRKDSLAFKDWQLNQWRKYLNPGIGRTFSDTKAQVDQRLGVSRNNLGISEQYKASNKITMQNAYQTYDMIFGNPNNFTILISSSYKAEQILPYITNIFGETSQKEQVSKNLTSTSSSKKIDPSNKIQVSSIPNANAFLAFKYVKKIDGSDWKTQLKAYILEKSLSNRISPIRYFENKALYFWTVTYYYHKESNQASISLFFPTLEEQVDDISKEVKKIISKLEKRTISEEELNEIKSNIPKTKFGKNWDSNSSLSMKVLYNYYKFNLMPPQKKEFEDYLESIRPKDIKAMAKEFFIEANKNKFIALPST